MYSGIIYYSNDDLELDVGDNTYTVAVEARASYYFSPGRMYMPNGDPGYPDESEFELLDVDATWYIYDEEKDENVEVPEENVTSEMESALDEYLEELDLDEWSE